MNFFRRRLLMSNNQSNNIEYPGLIAAWSAAGKSNDDADRNVLRDLTGNGHDITLNGFAFNTEGSGYGHPLYPDALVFDGVDDYGINEDMPILTDYTVIVKREWILNKAGAAYLISNHFGSSNGAFIMERVYNGRPGSTYSYGKTTLYTLDNNNNITWQTKNSYNGQSIGVGTSLPNNVITIGGLYKTSNVFKGAIYSAFLFDRSLDEQEIKAFIRKYIDADYVLPSEQTTE